MSYTARGVAGTVARYKLNATGKELYEPLLAVTDAVDSDDDSDEDKIMGDRDANKDIQKQGPLEKLKTIAVYGILGAALAASALSFVFAPQTLVFVAGSICIANIPYSAYKEYHLSKIPTLRSLNHSLRADANRLGQEVDVLTAEIDILEPEADRAKAVEGELREIADRQHFNVDRLVELVKENQDIVDALKDNLRKRVVQDIIKIVVDSDRDNDTKINKVESKMLALKIRIQLQEYGVDFDEAKFYQVLSVNPSVSRIISMVQKLSPHVVRVENEESTDEEDGKIEEDEDEETKAVYEMFTWQNEDDTEVSGRRESLMAPTRRKSRKSLRKRRLSAREERRSMNT